MALSFCKSIIPQFCGECGAAMVGAGDTGMPERVRHAKDDFPIQLQNHSEEEITPEEPSVREVLYNLNRVGADINCENKFADMPFLANQCGNYL